MRLSQKQEVDVPAGLIEAIQSFPLSREIVHCGVPFQVPPFDFYAQCPQCGERLKMRSFSGGTEIEDVFDAVFEWMNRPGAAELARRRREVIEADRDEDS